MTVQLVTFAIPPVLLLMEIGYAQKDIFAPSAQLFLHLVRVEHIEIQSVGRVKQIAEFVQAVDIVLVPRLCILAAQQLIIVLLVHSITPSVQEVRIVQQIPRFLSFVLHHIIVLLEASAQGLVTLVHIVRQEQNTLFLVQLVIVRLQFPTIH